MEKTTLIEEKSGRRVGNTTRQIDYAIQLLFTGHTVVVKDHWYKGERRDPNEYLFYRILDRLALEHSLRHMVEHKEIKIDKNKLILKLL